MQKENLIKFCKNILIKLNMDSDKAHATSEILVEADMMGHSTHGVRLLPNYVSDIEKGIMNVNGNYKIISEKKSNVRIVQVSKKVFNAMSYRDRPDGFISLFNTELIGITSEINGPILIPDQIEKPGNLGTMIRTAKSFGINNVFLSDEITDIFNPNVIRSSIGHLFNMNISSGTNKEIIELLKTKKYQIILLDPEGETTLENFKPDANFALVVGAEQYGISDDWFASNHISLSIRSTNNVDSLNASTAAAIGMWELTK